MHSYSSRPLVKVRDKPRCFLELLDPLLALDGVVVLVSLVAIDPRASVDVVDLVVLDVST